MTNQQSPDVTNQHSSEVTNQQSTDVTNKQSAEVSTASTTAICSESAGQTVQSSPISHTHDEQREVCIRLSEVSHNYESPSGDVRALEDLNLDIYDREFFVLVGPSGCGKSTLLRLMSGLIDNGSGEIQILKDVPSDRPVTNMVFQEKGIFPWKTVIDNVAFGLKMRGMAKARRYEIAREYIDKVDLSSFETAYPHELSGGMKQRVGIARAFANDPEIFLMDEPFGSLDAQTKGYLQEELLSLWQESKKTVVYVTHDIREAIRLGDRIGIMESRPGRIKEIIDVDIGRPRTRERIQMKRIDELEQVISNSLSSEVERSLGTRR